MDMEHINYLEEA